MSKFPSITNISLASAIIDELTNNKSLTITLTSDDQEQSLNFETLQQFELKDKQYDKAVLIVKAPCEKLRHTQAVCDEEEGVCKNFLCPDGSNLKVHIEPEIVRSYNVMKQKLDKFVGDYGKISHQLRVIFIGEGSKDGMCFQSDPNINNLEKIELDNFLNEYKGLVKDVGEDGPDVYGVLFAQCFSYKFGKIEPFNFIVTCLTSPDRRKTHRFRSTHPELIEYSEREKSQPTRQTKSSHPDVSLKDICFFSEALRFVKKHT